MRPDAALPDAILTDRVTAAAWRYVTDVQSSLGDIGAALTARDWPTSVEACESALRALLSCRLLLAGLVYGLRDGGLDVHVITSGEEVTVLLRNLPPADSATAAQARAAATAVRAAAAALERELPLPVPPARTADGQLVGDDVVARLLAYRDELDRLRAGRGLPPLNPGPPRTRTSADGRGRR